MQKSIIFGNTPCRVHITVNRNGFDNIWQMYDIDRSLVVCRFSF